MTSVEPVIVSRDVERLARFYADLLEAPLVEREPAEGPAFAMTLDVDGTRLTLVADEDVPDDVPGRVLLSFGVDDVAAAVGRVRAGGGEVLAEPQDMSWGQRVAHAADPDGNPVNLTQHL